MNDLEEISNYEDGTTAVHEIQAKLLQYILQYSNSVLDETAAQKVSNLSAQLIQALLQYSTSADESKSPVSVSQEVGKILDILVIISQLPQIKTVLVQKLAPVVFETISDPCISGWCGKEILRNFNVIIQNSDKKMRYKLIADNNLMHLFKLVDLLSVCGDYNYQTVIMECIFRMCTKEMLMKHSSELIPENRELCKKLTDIDNKTFDLDIRTFLNILNEKSKNVYSIVCDEVILDDVSLNGPFEYQLVGGLWVDFNIKFKSISWYVDETFYSSESHELLIIPAQSVEIPVIEMLDNNKIKISFELNKGGIIVQSGKVPQPKHVYFILQKTEKAELICSKIIKQIIVWETDFSYQNNVFPSLLKGSQENKIIAVNRGNNMKYKKFFCKNKPHISIENRLLQADLVEITSDEDDMELPQMKHPSSRTNLDNSDSTTYDSMTFPAEKSTSKPLIDIAAYEPRSTTVATYGLEVDSKKNIAGKHKNNIANYCAVSSVSSGTNMELSSKRKIAGKYKSNVSNYQYRSLSFLAEKVVSPVSFGTKSDVQENPKELESEYYTAQMECFDDRNKQDGVKELGLQNKLMQSKYIKGGSVMNEAASVDSDIERVNSLEPFKSSTSAKPLNNKKASQSRCIARSISTAGSKLKTLRDTPIKKQHMKIHIAKARNKQSSSSSSKTIAESDNNKSDKNCVTSDKISSATTDLSQGAESNSQIFKKSVGISESETPDGLDRRSDDNVEVAVSVITVNETPQKSDGLTNKFIDCPEAKNCGSPADHEQLENTSALQAKASDTVDDNRRFLNIDEIKQSLSSVSTEKLSNNEDYEDLHTIRSKCPTSPNKFASLQFEIMRDGSGSLELSQKQNVAIVIDKKYEKEEVLKLSKIPKETLSSTDKESQLKDCLVVQVASQTIPSSQHSDESNQEQIPPFQQITRNTELHQTNNQLSTLSEDKDLSSPIIVNRQYKKKGIVPVIEDDTSSSVSDNCDASNKESSVKPVSAEVKHISQDNIIMDRKSPVEILIDNQVLTEKIFFTEKQTEDSSQHNHSSSDKQTSQPPENADLPKDNYQQELVLSDIMRNAKLNIRNWVVKIERCDFSTIIQNSESHQTDGQLSKNEDSSSPPIIDRKRKKRTKFLPIIEDNICEDYPCKIINKESSDKEVYTDKDQKQDKDVFENKKLPTVKLISDAKIIPASTVKPSSLTEKELKAVECMNSQDVSQKKAVAHHNHKSRGEKLLITSQIIKNAEDVPLSPVIVMARDKLVHVRTQKKIKETSSRTKVLESINEPVVEKRSAEQTLKPEETVNYEILTQLENQQKVTDDVEPGKIASGPVTELHDDHADQLQQTNVVKGSETVNTPVRPGKIIGNNDVTILEDNVEEVPNETVFNITKTTTASSKRRKLFIPDDLSYMESLPNIKENDEKSIKDIKSNNQKENETDENLLQFKFGKGMKRKSYRIRNEHPNKKYKSYANKKNKLVCDLNKWLEAIEKQFERDKKELEKYEKHDKEKGKKDKGGQQKQLQRSVKRKRSDNKTGKQNRKSYKELKVSHNRDLYKKARVEKQSDKNRIIPEKPLLIPKEKKIRVISNVVLQKAKQPPQLETVTEVVNEEKANHERIFQSSNKLLNRETSISEASVALSWESEIAKVGKDKNDFVQNWLTYGGDAQKSKRK